jgi:CRP-like cAMP-binding protein
MGARRRRQFTIEEIETALRANGGIQAAAAQALEQATGLRVTPQSIFERVKDSPQLQKVIQESQEEVLDLAENVLLTALRRNDRDAVNAARFLLETRGRHRGYARRDYLQHAVDPRRLSDEELTKAIRELEAITIDAEPVTARALPAPVKRPRN